MDELEELGARKDGSDSVGQVRRVFFPRTPFTSQSDVRTGEGISDGSDRVGRVGQSRTGQTRSGRRGGDGAPGVAVKRVAEPALELSGPVALPDGAGTAFYFLRGQHAAKLERNGRVRAPVSIFERELEKLGGLGLCVLGAVRKRKLSFGAENAVK